MQEIVPLFQVLIVNLDLETSAGPPVLPHPIPQHPLHLIIEPYPTLAVPDHGVHLETIKAGDTLDHQSIQRVQVEVSIGVRVHEEESCGGGKGVEGPVKGGLREDVGVDHQVDRLGVET
jgi:hypothetical protein